MNLLAALLTYSLAFPAQDDIVVQITENDSKLNQLVFIAPHENESVANAYLREKIDIKGGKFIEIRQHGERHLTLQVNNKAVQVDPNRIFTPLGRQATLKKLNPSLKVKTDEFKKAKAKTKQLAEFLLKQLKFNQQTSALNWIAMHNNTNGYSNDGKGGEGSVSIIRYQNKLTNGAKFLSKVHQTKHDEDDLFYVTFLADFEQMKKDGWNVVLESPIVKTDADEDDGSLSVFANKNNIRYINIEAERKGKSGGADHLVEKKAMIDYVYSLIRSNESK